MEKERDQRSATRDIGEAFAKVSDVLDKLDSREARLRVLTSVCVQLGHLDIAQAYLTALRGEETSPVTRWERSTSAEKLFSVSHPLPDKVFQAASQFLRDLVDLLTRSGQNTLDFADDLDNRERYATDIVESSVRKVM